MEKSGPTRLFLRTRTHARSGGALLV